MSQPLTPNQILQKIKESEIDDQKGKLRIYFGAVAGVGKTYTMLYAAKEAQEKGREVLVGVVETHGRKETIAQVEGLTVLPKKAWNFLGKALYEFDLDAAIAAQPDLLLIDELAHSNVEGSRHPKRWQDVAELLESGVDVWTTLNVQHLESLKGVIEHITGVPIHETVPDSFFDSADEIVLVDTTAEELTNRLHAGHIYGKEQAQRAHRNFFRKGNLISLREIALRRTAECIETDVKTYRQKEAIQSVWPTDSGVLVCLRGDEKEEHLIRSAARLAGQVGCEWHVVYVVVPTGTKKQSLARQDIAIEQLRFAESLDAQTTLLQAEDAAAAFVGYAREHNLPQIMCLAETKRRFWQKSLSEKMIIIAPEINMIQVGQQAIHPHTKRNHFKIKTMRAHKNKEWPKKLGAYSLALFLSVLLAAILYPLADILDNANVVMIFLVLIVIINVKLGRSVGVFASIVCVGLFDFGFVMPQHSFAVGDVQYLITLIVMLGVGLLTGQYALNLKYRANVANRRERQAISLFEFARNLSGLLEFDEIVRQSELYILQEFKGKVYFLLPDENDKLISEYAPADLNIPIAQLAYSHQQEAGFGTNTLPQHPFLYLPLKAPIRIRGILAIAPKEPKLLWFPEKRRQLDIFANLIALTFERIHFAHVANLATLDAESEKMRSILLATISHDLRTPLTALMGESQWLQGHYKKLSNNELETSLASMNECSERLYNMVSNLLEMARLQSNQFSVNKEWQSIEEIIGSVTHAISFSHPEAVIKTALPTDCPLVECDGVLIERVLTNLIDNGIKYSKKPAEINIDVKVTTDEMKISVLDQGEGINPERLEAIFQKFTRGQSESSNIGAGLGLSIAKTVVEAHGGEIYASLRSECEGSHFWFTLPLKPAPKIVVS